MEIKEKIIEFYNKNSKKILLVGLFVIVISICFVLINRKFNKNENITKMNQESVALVENVKVDEKEIVYVDIKGYVKNPGVYEMSSDSRIFNVIETSGGLLPGASTKYINLSQSVTDEMVIVIYSESEIEELKTKETVEEIKCLCEETINDACFIDESYNIVSGYNTSENVITSSLININIASKEELLSLPGIGESKATSIIEYRNTFGNFKTKEDLMEVSGIGESIYSKVKDLITTE